MANNTRKQIKYLTVGAMLSALGVVILALGSVIEVIDLTVAVIASLLCVWAVIELGGIYPWMIWIVTSVVGILILPLKTPALFYAVAFGFYPMIKELAEKNARTLSWLIKLVTFHICMGLMFLGLYLFFPAILEESMQELILLGLYFVSLAIFIIYDIALSRLITLYVFKFRKRFQLK